MFKKALAVIGVSGLLLLGASSAATAATPSYPPPGGPSAGDTTIVVGEGTTITVNGVGNEVNVTFIVIAGPGGASLASLVPAAVQPSVTKEPVGDTASAVFRATAAGDHTIAITGASGTSYGSVTISVAAAGPAGGAASDSSGGLAATGGVVPAAAMWLGIGAIGIGGIAVAAVAARRRAASNR